MSDNDDWIFGSIKRYDHLIMVYLVEKPLQIELTGPDTFAVLGHDSDPERTLITTYTVPPKIQPNRKDIVNSTDLEVKSGGYTGDKVCQISSNYGTSQVVTAETGRENLWSRRLDSPERGFLQKLSPCLQVPLIAPKFVRVGNNYFAARKATDPSYFIKMNETGDYDSATEIILKFEGSSRLLPITVSERSYGALNEGNGAVCFLDVRDTSQRYSCAEEMTGIWSCALDCDARGSEAKHLVKLSSEGDLKLYDVRDLDHPVLSSRIDVKLRNLSCKLSPNGRLVSVGVGGEIWIYTLGFDRIFLHEGHMRTGTTVENCTVTDHFWWNDSCLVSTADNSSLNIWQFREDT